MAAKKSTLRQLKKRRRKSELRIADTVFASQQSMVIADLDGVILRVNPGFTALTGYSAEEAVGRHTRLLKSGLNDAAFYAAMWDAIIKTGYWQGEIWNRKKGGELYAQWLTITTVRDEDGQPSHYIGTQTDITDTVNQRAQMERELTAYSMRLNLASRQLQTMQEEIRRRLAGELHDRTKPNLATIDINLSIVEAQLGDAFPQLAGRLADSRALVEDTEASIREICAELRPPVLDHAGLAATLKGYAFQFSKRSGIPVSFVGDYVAGSLSPALESMMFRVFQEALTNTLKHAQASVIQIALADKSGRVTLSITDDGCGFATDRLNPPGQPGLIPGLGLRNMHELVTIYGGHLDIQSQPGQGTKITVDIQEAAP
jgi:PAS domain S-box-containing protein